VVLVAIAADVVGQVAMQVWVELRRLIITPVSNTDKHKES